MFLALGLRSRNACDNESMKIRVECYAGAKPDERPVRFHLGERLHIVEELLDQWYGPDDTFFKVRADDGNLYILRKHNSSDGTWALESFRQIHDGRTLNHG